MRIFTALLLLSLTVLGDDCKDHIFSGLLIKATKVESNIYKIETDMNRIFYIKTGDVFLPTKNDSVYICWFNYSTRALTLQNDIRQFKVLDRYMEGGWVGQ